jgi:predicted heme/steroid binding protein
VPRQSGEKSPQLIPSNQTLKKKKRNGRYPFSSINVEMTLWLVAAVLLVGTFIYFTLFGNNNKQLKGKKENTRTAVAASIKPKELKKYSLEEISKHNHEKDCWIIVDGKVYDVTEYIFQHPGGDSILNNAGRDSSIGFHGPQHPDTAKDFLAFYEIGEVIPSK